MLKNFQAISFFKKARRWKMVEEKLEFNLSNIHQQEFQFPVKLIEYVNKEADAEIKQMLDRSCKYFYNEVPYLIIDSLEINQAKQRMENETYGGCIDFMDDDQLQIFLMNTSNIWVTKKVDVSLRENLDIRGNNIDVQLFNRVVRSDAKEISIYNMNLSFSDYKRITKSRNVQYLDLSSSIISDLDKAFVSLEDVLVMVPNARVIRMFDSRITSDTMKKLLEIPWKQKIIELNLNNVDGPLCSNLFFKFVKKHVDAEGSLHVCFKHEPDTFQKFYNQMVIEYGERIITNIAPILKKQSKMQKVLSWMASIASIIEIIQGESALPLIKSSAPKQLTKATYNDENVERQYTAFPYPHMCYIRENADGELWKKLERTCKFFYQKNPYLMVDDLCVTADGKFSLLVDDKMLVFENGNEIEKIDKPFWITNSIHITAGATFRLSVNIRIHAKEISINLVVLSKRSFLFFTKSRLVIKWDSLHSLVKNDNDKVISLHELLSQLPNAENVSAYVRGINSQNAIQPIIFPQRNNVKQLSLRFLKDIILAPQLFDVLKKSLAPKAHILLDFREWIEGMNVAEFKAQMKTLLDTWKSQIEKPTFKIIF